MGKRTKAALKVAGKRTKITSKQRTARRVNIEVARRAKKSGQKGSSKGAGSKSDLKKLTGADVKGLTIKKAQQMPSRHKKQVLRDLQRLDTAPRANRVGSERHKRYKEYQKRGWAKNQRFFMTTPKFEKLELTDKGFRAMNKIEYG